MSYSQVDYERPTITFKQAQQIASCAFGKKGEAITAIWNAYNHEYFRGKLKPVPIIFVPTSPYGHWIGLSVGTKNKKSALIYLKSGESWDDTRSVLLHEMIHQCLVERGANPKHESQDWCDEIMRISRNYFGCEFWAGRYTVGKERTEDGRRVSRKMNKAGPDGEASIPMKDIVSWPFSLGITPPDIDNIKKTPHPPMLSVG